MTAEFYDEMDDGIDIPEQQIIIKISNNKYSLIDLEKGKIKFTRIETTDIGDECEQKNIEKFVELKMKAKIEKAVIKNTKSEEITWEIK